MGSSGKILRPGALTASENDFAAAAVFAAMVLIAANMIAAASAVSLPEQSAGSIPVLTIEGWERTGDVEVFEGKGLYGYINGGAEIFLQYGFKELAVTRYARVEDGDQNAGTSRTVTLEIYRMASPEEAFGIFSVRRSGNETVAPALDVPHWISGGQAALVQGNNFINILGDGVTEGEITAFTFRVAAKIGAPARLPRQLSWLPPEKIIARSERLLLGRIAAAEESPLLDQDFWGFAEGTSAVSARYGLSGSKLVIIRLQKDVERLSERVNELFREYLEDVRTEGDFLSAKNAAGRAFAFKCLNRRAFLVLSAPDDVSARLLINQAERQMDTPETEMSLEKRI